MTLHLKTKEELIEDIQKLQLENNSIKELYRTDIVESRKAEDELKRSGERFRILFEAAPDAIILADPATSRILDANIAACRMLMLERNEVIGMHQAKLHPPQMENVARQTFKKHISESEEQGFTQPIESLVLRSDGTTIPVEILAQIVRLNDHDMLMGTFRDITERKQAERKILENKEILTGILNSTRDVIWSSTWPDFKVLFISPSAEKIFGRPLKDFDGNTLIWKDVVHPDDRHLTDEALELLIKHGKTSRECRIIHPDGHISWIYEKSELIYDENNNPVKLTGIASDITERKQAELALQQEQLFSHSVINSLPGIFYLYSYPEMRLVKWNKNHETMLGFGPEELMDRPVTAWHQPEAKATVIAAMEEVMQKGHYRMEAALFKKDGSSIPFILTGVRLEVDGKKYIMGIGIDITERIKAEDSLRHEQYLMDALMNNVPAHIYFKDHESRFIRINKSHSRYFGLEYPQLANGKTDFDFFTAEHAQQAFDDEKEIMRTGLPISRDEKETRVGHSDTWVSTTKLPLFNKSNEIIGTFGISVDITENKLAEEALRKSEDRLQTILQTAMDGFWLVDLKGNLLEVNDTYCRMSGYSADELLGMNISELETPEYAIESSLRIRKIVENGETRYISQHRRKDGSIFDVEISGQYQATENGRIVAFLHDITERKLVEEELRANEEKFRDLFEANTDGITIFLVNPGGPPSKIIDMNENAAKMLGYTKAEMLQMTPTDVEKDFTPDKIGKRMQDLLTKGQSDFETILIHKDNHDIHVEIKVRVVKYNKQLALMNIVRDITERKKAELELIIAKEKAVESDRLKSAFLANMSHEIRTPMNGILGFAELLKEPNLSGEQQQEYIRIIKKSGDRMLNIINDIIDISKIESGQMKVHLSDANINEQLEYMHTFFIPEANKKGIHLSYTTGLPAREASIKTDREKLYAILTNLVKNALKFTNEGAIEFGYLLQTKKVNAELEFFIKDTGIGVATDRQEAIFERFIQADISDKQAKQGAGLGLSITRAYVEMLGGRIWMESEIGSGSTFYFSIPYEPIHKPTNFVSDNEALAKSNTLNNLKILIAEDDETSDLLISLSIKKICCEVLHSNNGKSTVDICRQNPDIDLILMDIKMPEMDGYEATRMIRRFNKDVIIIAQTAYALFGDKEKAMDAGCNNYIAKPIQIEELKAMLAGYL